MSLFFRPQEPSNNPTQSRTIGFGQVTRVVAPPDRQAVGFQSTPTTGDINMDFSQTLQMSAGANNSFNFDVALNNTQYTYNNSNTVNTSYPTLLNNYMYNLEWVTSEAYYINQAFLECEDLEPGAYCDVCTKIENCDLCTQLVEDEECNICPKLTECSGETITTKTVIEDVQLDGDCGAGLCFKYAEVQYNEYGLIVAWETLPECGCIATTTCE